VTRAPSVAGFVDEGTSHAEGKSTGDRHNLTRLLSVSWTLPRVIKVLPALWVCNWRHDTTVTTYVVGDCHRWSHRHSGCRLWYDTRMCLRPLS